MTGEDAQLLRRYALDGSEAAFGELVRRHVDLVYSAAVRVLNGDNHRAQDVTQQVFSELARQAKTLSRHPSLVGWLYTTTRHMGLHVVRSEQRRATREKEATSMNELLCEPDSEPAWTELRPVLDDAMHELGETDRGAVLLRYFKNQTLGEIGREMGLSENAVRMRVERALDKLRVCLARRGVTSTGSALALALSTQAVGAAPAGFVATLASASLAGATAASGSSLTFLQIMTATKLKLGLAALVIATAGTTLLIQQPSHARIRRENELLRQQLAAVTSDNEYLSNRLLRAKSALRPALPAPPIQVSSTAGQPVPIELQPTNLYARVKDKESRLTTAQVGQYLDANRRNAASLLAAYRTTGDATLLDEAKKRFPNDPQVAFEAAFKKDAPPEERKRWVESLKKSDPENSLPNYLAALESFKAGQTDQGVQELVAASAKQQFQDYTLDRVQDDEDAYLAAGYSVAEAKTIPSRQLLLPQLLQMRDLSQQMIDLSKAYQQSGDAASAQALLQMTANLGQRYSMATPGESEISQLVGMAVERNALRAMDPGSSYGNGTTVQQRLDQIAQQRDTLNQLNSQLEPILEKMSDQDWISYKDRWRAFGEQAAVRWVVAKYGANGSE
jgi:RNA polymerase sigma factor (sigma-70 family)